MGIHKAVVLFLKNKGKMLSEENLWVSLVAEVSKEVLVTRSCPTLVIPWTAALQASLSMESPGKNTGVGSHSLLQGISPTQGSNWGLLHCRQILYQLSYQGSP